MIKWGINPLRDWPIGLWKMVEFSFLTSCFWCSFLSELPFFNTTTNLSVGWTLLLWVNELSFWYKWQWQEMTKENIQNKANTKLWSMHIFSVGISQLLLPTMFEIYKIEKGLVHYRTMERWFYVRSAVYEYTSSFWKWWRFSFLGKIYGEFSVSTFKSKISKLW